ncbi:MAG: YihY/virulence factor BrkB family protein [Spirochaetales bacterium]|nr:YihY/virulence factor BrkB family protein [Spirochaetales bacterium]
MNREPAGPMQIRVARFFHLGAIIIRRFFSDSCFPRAAGLAYSTLMSSVPLLAVLIGFGGPFMAEERVQSFLASTMLPAMQEPIMEAVLELVENGTRLGILGLPVFLVAVIILLNNIEMNLNHIFRVSMERRGLKWITTHLGVVLFAGLFVGSSLTLTGDMLEQILKSLGYTRVFILFEKQLAPFLFIFLGQFILLTIIPRRKVHPGSALIAALTGTVLWELSKKVFAVWATRTVRMSLIYGSFFIIPLMLIWLIIIWIIILLMAEFTFVHQNRRFYDEKNRLKQSPGDQLLYCLRLFSLIHQAYAKGEPAPSADDLAETLLLPETLVEELLTPLLEKGLILKVVKKRKDYAFVPGEAPKGQSAAELMEVLINADNPGFELSHDPLLKPLLKDIKNALNEKSMADYLDAHD